MAILFIKGKELPKPSWYLVQNNHNGKSQTMIFALNL